MESNGEVAKRDNEGILIVNSNRCKSCIFNPNQKTITVNRLLEIQEYLIKGISHECHVTNLICRGSREFQAQIFYRMGLISEPHPDELNNSIKNYHLHKNNVSI